MASTAIFLSPYHAEFTNMVYLPSHAVALQIFPAGIRSNIHRYLSERSDLHYFALHSYQRVNRTDPLYKSAEGFRLSAELDYYLDCIATNASSFEATAEPACRAANLQQPMIVPLEELRSLLNDAIDCTGLFSGRNKAWLDLPAEYKVDVPGFRMLPTDRYHHYG